MMDRTQLGWRIPQSAWDRFVDAVIEKHADQDLYLRVELESAMMEFLDEDDLLAEAEEILREHTPCSELSSSTAAIATTRYQDDDTRLVTHRIRTELKERFQAFAKKHDAPSYGRLLAAALDSYARGGRAQRLLTDVKRVFSGSDSGATSSGSTTDSVEDSSTETNEAGSSEGTVENSLSTAVRGATSTGSSGETGADPERPDPMVVSDAVDEVLSIEGTNISDLFQFPRGTLDKAIARAAGAGDRETIDRYHDPVLEQLNASEHPHIDGVYITDWAREDECLWADLNKAERIVLLRRWAVAEAIRRGNRKQPYTYREVIDLFEKQCKAGPSHQYAYDLMEAAADEAGFTYGESSIGTNSTQVQLRVDVSSVSPT